MIHEDLKKVLDLHALWLKGSPEGARAYLRRANLCEADLREANGILSFGPMKTSGRMIYAVKHEDKWMVQAGSFWGDLDALEVAVKEKHNDPLYMAIINLLRNYEQ